LKGQGAIEVQSEIARWPHLKAVAGGRDWLLNVRQVAERLGVHRAAVYRLAEKGELPHVRVSNAIRVVPADLEAFIAARRIGGRR